MKNLAQRLISSIAFLSVCIGANSETVEIDGIKYDLSNGRATVVGCSDNVAGDLVIPSAITDGNVEYKVTAIGESAFSGRSLLSSITLPEGLDSIKSYAFNGCSGIKQKFIIPQSVRYVGTGAFSGCSFTTINIPKNIRGGVCQWSLSTCKKLTDITVDEGNDKYYFSGGMLFCKNDTLVACPGGRDIGDYTVPSNIKAINDFAFYHKTGNFSVTLPENFSYLGYGAFMYSELTSINLPGSIEKIPVNAFKDTRLKNVTIGEGTKFIEYEAFFANSYLETVSLPSTVVEVGQCAFTGGRMTAISVDSKNENYISDNGVLMSRDKTELVAFPCGITGSYTVPSCVRSINERAFYGANINSVEISEGVEKIGVRAFANCFDLKDITLPASVSGMEENAFEGCLMLKSVTVKRKEPAVISSTAFDRDYNRATLYVPVGSKELYAAAEGWKIFTVIEEKDFTSGISRSTADATTTETARYNVGGMKAGNSGSGISIIRMSDGKTIKTVNKYR